MWIEKWAESQGMEVVKRKDHLSRESGRGQDYRSVYRFRLAYASLVASGGPLVVDRLGMDNVSALSVGSRSLSSRQRVTSLCESAREWNEDSRYNIHRARWSYLLKIQEFLPTLRGDLHQPTRNS